MTNNPDLDRWQERYAAPGYLFGKAPNAFVKNSAHLLPKTGRALAIADGEGRNGVFLAERGLTVTSVDFSPLAQDKARALAAERGVAVTFEQANILIWDWPAESFDVVAAIFFQFTGAEGRAKIFAGIKKALKPGGLLLLEGYGVKQLEYRTGGPSTIENLYTRDLLEQAFADFSSVEVREYDTVIEEGAAHGGMSALVDLVARK